MDTFPRFSELRLLFLLVLSRDLLLLLSLDRDLLLLVLVFLSRDLLLDLLSLLLSLDELFVLEAQAFRSDGSSFNLLSFVDGEPRSGS